jgi:two-component sensor histidine kinase
MHSTERQRLPRTGLALLVEMVASLKKWSLNYWIAIFTGVIVLLIAVLLTLAISRARRDALAQASLKASYLSEALAEEAEGQLDTLAVATEFVKRRVETEGDAVPLAVLKGMISSYIRSLDNIAVMGADGGLQATSGDVTSVPSNFSQFDFFRINRDSSSVGFRIGDPVAGLLPNRLMIPATQSLQTEDGKFAGVVLFLLDPERATEMYHRVDLGSSGSLELIGTDGIVFFGYTLPRGLDPSVIGSSAATESTLAQEESGTSGSYIARSSVDGIERVYSWRRLANFPLIAIVGLGKAEALAAANRQAIRLIVLAVLTVGFLLGLTIRLSREISRRIKQTQALAETNARLTAAFVDIAERKRHEEHINLLLSEVNHRSKNILAVVQAIARQTVAATPDDFIERFDDRIQALSASQDLLVNNDWKGVDLRELTRSQLGHLGDLVDKRIELNGPALLLSASAAQAIGMAVHELATNARKYGALSNDSGRVDIGWSLEPGEDGEKTFVITWRESGGPAVAVPTRAGFGSAVLCQVAKESFGAEVELKYAATGVVWRLQCAAREVLIDGNPST